MMPELSAATDVNIFIVEPIWYWPWMARLTSGLPDVLAEQLVVLLLG